MKRITLIIISAAVVMAFASAVWAAPRVLTYPLTLQTLSNNITITWDDGSGGAVASADIIYGTSPMNYTGAPLTQSASNVCNFTPNSPAVGMTGGVYYCRVSNNADGSWSNEFKIYVDTNLLVQQTYPVNQALNSLAPVFQWQALSGVPYYTILVFDAQPSIQTSGNGTTVTANVIWGAITSGTGIQYGSSDPSGYYNNLNPPPLMPGITYAWAVIKDYNGTPSIMSSSIITYKLFTVLPASACPAPVLSAPADGANLTTADQPINLSWTDTGTGAASPNNYKVVVRKIETGGIQFGGDLLVPVWSAFTNSTNITIPQNIALNTNKYDWYVVALDSSGRGSKSVDLADPPDFERTLNYTDPTDADMELDFKDSANNVPDVVVFLQTSTGGQVDAFPFVANDQGMFDYQVPAGTYTVLAKKEGYDDRTFSVTVPGGPFNLQMTKSVYTISGIVTDGTNPVQGAGVLATENGTTFTASANTAADGSFTLGAGTNNADWTILVSKAGYQSAQRAITVPNGSFIYTIAGNIVITKNMNTLSGTVTNSLSQGINGALVTVEQNGNTANVFTATTGFTGAYTLQLPDGTWLINVTAPGFVSPPQSSATLSLGGSAVRDFTMQDQADQISGYVVDSLDNVMQNVQVGAVPSSGPTVDTISDNLGHYSLSVGTGTYTVTAILSGYTSTSQIVSFASGGLSASGNITMTANAGSQNDAVFYAIVTATSSAAIPGAFVSIQGNAGVTLGFSGSALTDATGGAAISGMKPGNYNVSITKTGYTAINTVIALVSGQTTGQYQMAASASTGVIAGTALDPSAAPVAGAVVVISDQSNPGTPVFTGATDAGGAYTSTLDYGSYVVQVFKDGYSSAPAQAYLALSSASAAANFTLTKALPGVLLITPPSVIVYNENIGGPYNFSEQYLDGTGNNYHSTAAWSLQPASAGQISSAGIMTPTADYIGEVTVIASALGVTGSVSVPVWQNLTASAPYLTSTVKVQDYAGFKLTIPPASVDPSNTLTKITLSKGLPSVSRGMVDGVKVAGLVYDLTDGFKFTSNVSLTLPLLPGLDQSSASIGVWDTPNLKWKQLGGTKSGTDITYPGITHFSEYAVVNNSKELGLSFITLNPDPFRPANGGLNINYSPTSNVGGAVKTTIKIYNMDAKYVATVVDGVMRNTSAVSADVWNGKTAKGQMAKNGRYLVQIELEDASGKKQFLYPVVMIK